MLREEAEREADRLNREDESRARFEFYAFDESAGLADHAWEVAARLREGPPPEASRPAAPAPAEPQEPVLIEGPTVAQTDPFATPDPFGDPAAFAEEWAVEPTTRERRRAPRARPRRRRREDATATGAEPEEARSGLFVRVLGAVVIVVGMLWMAMVVALAVFLKPDDLTSFAVYLGAAVLGLLAILLGVAIRRS